MRGDGGKECVEVRWVNGLWEDKVTLFGKFLTYDLFGDLSVRCWVGDGWVEGDGRNSGLVGHWFGTGEFKRVLVTALETEFFFLKSNLFAPNVGMDGRS